MIFNSDAERSQFIEKNLRLVTSRVLKLNNRCYDDDLFQVGVEALIETLDRFDESRGTKFSTYATYCIDGKIRTYKNYDTTIKPLHKKTDRGNFQYKSIESMNKVISTDDIGNELTVNDTLANDCNVEEEVISKLYDRDFSIYLTKREQRVLDLLLEDKTQKEIAEIFNVSQQQISLIKKNIQEKYVKCHKWRYL